MFILPIIAALGASFGWACGIVLAHAPARALGSFEFTRVQLIAVGAILSLACSILGYWQSVDWAQWPAYAVSIILGIILGNLAMIECLRRGGPRRTELLLSLKAPIVAIIAYLWLGETLTASDLLGGVIALAGVSMAILFGGGRSAEFEAIEGSLIAVIFLGAFAAICHGVGFLLMKPIMQAGTEPIVVSAVRITGASLVISLVALWPAKAFKPKTMMTPNLLFRTILPGFIGYGVSSTLLLYAFANFNAGTATVLGSLSPVMILPIIWIKNDSPPHAMAWCGAVLTVVGTVVLVFW